MDFLFSCFVSLIFVAILISPALFGLSIWAAILLESIFMSGTEIYLNHRCIINEGFDGLSPKTLRNYMESIGATSCFGGPFSTEAIFGTAYALSVAAHAYNQKHNRHYRHRIVNGRIEGVPVERINEMLTTRSQPSFLTDEEKISYCIYTIRHPTKIINVPD